MKYSKEDSRALAVNGRESITLRMKKVVVVDGILLSDGQGVVQTELLPRFILSTLVAHNVHSLSKLLLSACRY